MKMPYIGASCQERVMSRDDLVEAGTRAICERYVPTLPADDDLREAVGVVVDAVEPLIRADVLALFDGGQR